MLFPRQFQAFKNATGKNVQAKQAKTNIDTCFVAKINKISPVFSFKSNSNIFMCQTNVSNINSIMCQTNVSESNSSMCKTFISNVSKSNSDMYKTVISNISNSNSSIVNSAVKGKYHDLANSTNIFMHKTVIPRVKAEGDNMAAISAGQNFPCEVPALPPSPNFVP